jgi:hypothetical protein
MQAKPCFGFLFNSKALTAIKRKNNELVVQLGYLMVNLSYTSYEKSKSNFKVTLNHLLALELECETNVSHFDLAYILIFQCGPANLPTAAKGP